MKKKVNLITRNPFVILAIAVVLLLPSLYGFTKTKVNYDILTYLPKNLDSTRGQELLNTTFKDAATSMLIIDNMDSKDVVKIKDKIDKVEGVEKTLWINDVMDTSIPKEMLPDDVKNMIYKGNSTLLLITYKEPASSTATMNAIGSIKKLLNKQCFLSGMSAIIKDTKDLADRETPLYVGLAVLLALAAMLLTMESTVEPFIFLMGIFFAVAYNFGTNIFLKNISYITKCIAGVLQLAVTMDYSIFLLDRYDEEKQKYEDRRDAMTSAIEKTFAALAGSSLTTIAGFLALCFMKLKIGMDIGIVMAKGVVIGVLCVVTILPALVLIFDKPMHKYKHKTILPEFKKTSNLVINKYIVFAVIFALLFIPAIFGQANTKVYYTLDESLPKNLDSIVATNKLKAEYNMATTHFILIKDSLEPYKVNEMVQKIEGVDGIEKVIAYEKYVGPEIPESFIPQDIKDIFKKGGYQMIIANSKYKAARNEENEQINDIKKIVKSYDREGLVAGEGPLTKDLIDIANRDFTVTNYISIAAIFVIVMLVFKSLSVPIFLVLAIELAIFINMAVPFYTGVTIPFIASVIIGCIQLGSTVDYAILLTTRFREELRNGLKILDAMKVAVRASAKSIITSALVFFAATGGVAIVSKMAMIKSLCEMLARGAVISAAVIIFLLPSILIIFEKFISKTSMGWIRNSSTTTR